MIFTRDLALRLAVITYHLQSSTASAVLAKADAYYEPLDAGRMHRAAQCLLGEIFYLVSRGASASRARRGVM